MFDENPTMCISLDESPILGIRLSDERVVETVSSPYYGLKRYRVIKGAVDFQYNERDSDGYKQSGRVCLEWLLNFAREHLRNGATKFYYAHLWDAYDIDKKRPKMKNIDPSKFKPSEKEFEFGHHTIWEFVDSSIKL